MLASVGVVFSAYSFGQMVFGEHDANADITVVDKVFSGLQLASSVVNLGISIAHFVVAAGNAGAANLACAKGRANTATVSPCHHGGVGTFVETPAAFRLVVSRSRAK